MLEVEARARGAGVIAFGFNADNLVATMVTWLTSGFRMGGIPVREIGDMRYVFPLYRITKKELTLYLELVRRAEPAGHAGPVHDRTGRAVHVVRDHRPSLRLVARY